MLTSRDGPQHPADWPRLEIGNAYVFGGTAGTVLAMTVGEAGGLSGFEAGGAQYCFHLDLDGDSRQNLTLRATFAGGPRSRQEVRLARVDGSAPGWRDAPGVLLAAGATDSLICTVSGLRLWSGRAGDPSWLHGGLVEAAVRCVSRGEPFDTLAGLRQPGMNLLAHGNVQAVVVELPSSLLTRRTGMWVTTAAPAGTGWVSVSRAARPLMADLFPVRARPVGGPARVTDFQPADDPILYGPAVLDGAARAARALGTAANPAAHGARVAAALLPDVLRYRPGTRADYACGNGRGLRDRAAEAVLSLVLGTSVPYGFGPESVTSATRAFFPYLGAPVPEPGQAPP